MEKKRATTMGKQKIEIKKIESEEARQVCFSKRKHGIFSKASELATLCGAQVAMMIESPAGCPYTFGSPSVGAVFNRFYDGGASCNGTGSHGPRRLYNVQNSNDTCMDLSLKLDELKKRKASLKQRIEELAEKNEDVRRAENAENLSFAELRKLKQTFTDLREKIKMKMFSDIVNSCGNGLTENPSTTMQNFFGAGTGPASDVSNLEYHDNMAIIKLQ